MMVKPAGQQLLLPVNGLFIWGTLILAMLVNMLPLGRLPGAPDGLLMLLVIWTMRQPLRVGLTAAFFFGLTMDVHQTCLLGQHAIVYCVIGYLARLMHRRVLWFGYWGQALQVGPLFFLGHLLDVLLRLALGGQFPGFWWLLAPVLETALWPILSWLLLLPQMRAPERDDSRPL
jgi:rod shape-determining protein MreD